MKKLVKFLGWFAISVLFIFILVTIGIYIHLKDDNWIGDVVPKYVSCTQNLYGYVKLMELAELSDMKIDDSVAKEIYEYAKEFYDKTKNADHSMISFTILTELLYIYSYYDFDYSHITEEIDKYYVTDKGLFWNEIYNDEDNIYNNIDMLRMLYNTGYNSILKYSIKENLIEWFNEDVKKNNRDEKTKSNYLAILRMYAEEPEMAKKLDANSVKDIIQERLNEVMLEIDKFESNISDVYKLSAFTLYNKVYNLTEEDYFEKTKELYSKISTFEDMNYYGEETCMIIMASYLKEYFLIFDTIYNEFLDENLSKIIYEHFEKYSKGYLEK